MSIFTCALFLFSSPLFAQKQPTRVILKKDFEVQKYTVLERFETAFMITATERAELKKRRIADAEHTLNVLDTICVSDRKRRQLVHDLKYNPVSERLTQFIVETKLEDDAITGLKQ